MLILVVDDSEMSRSVLEKMLSLSGYETAGASDGEEALEIARRRRPDLIISDIMMPSSDGYQFLRNIRMDPGLKDVPFIFYSAAYTSPEDVDFGYDLGATRFVQKPQNPRKILELVGELLKGNGGAPVPKTEPLEEPRFLKAHSERVVEKLDQKVGELEHTQSFLETVLNSMAEGLVVIGRDYRIIDANYAACTLFKLSKEDIVGHFCYEVFHGIRKPCGLATALCPFSEVFEKGGEAETTYNHTVCCDGHILEVKASPVRDRRGNVSSMVEIIRDVTERCKLEDEVQARIQELEEFYDASVGKELRLIELEKEVRRLRERLRAAGLDPGPPDDPDS